MSDFHYARGNAPSGGSSLNAWLLVSGMDCESCATAIQQELGRVAGVLRAAVSFDTSVARVAYDPARTFPGRLLEAVHHAARDGKHRFEADVVRVGSG